MADVAKWLTHLTVDQALVSSSLICRPIFLKVRSDEIHCFFFYIYNNV